MMNDFLTSKGKSKKRKADAELIEAFSGPCQTSKMELFMNANKIKKVLQA